MKAIYKYLSIASSAMILMGVASCKDDDKTAFGEWDANPDYAAIQFEKLSESKELAPTDPTIYTVNIKRRNTKGALTVKLDVLENTDNVFQVGDATFADGEADAALTLNFPTAEVGKSYRLKLTTSDPRFVSSYSDSIVYQFSVIRVLWSSTHSAGDHMGEAVAFYYEQDEAGNYILDENGKKKKKEGYAMYTDDFVASPYGLQNTTYPVVVQERDDQPGVYRILNAYAENFPYNDPGDWDDSQDYAIVIDATDPDKVFINPSIFELGVAWSDGMFSVVHLGGNYHMQAVAAEAAGDDATAEEMESLAEPYYGKLANGVITFPTSAFYISEANYNGGAWYGYANSNGAFKLVLNPDLSPYIADINTEDFQWEDVFEGAFTSPQLGVTSTAILQVGTCVNTTDDADKRWAKENGTAYRIVSAYEDGYDLYFSVLNGEVNIPNGLELQPTGLQALGQDVYAKIDAGKSSFSERVVDLSITFTNKDGSVEYGTSIETIAYITWTKVGSATYYYEMEDEEENLYYEPDEGLEVFVRDDKENIFKLTNWYNGGELIFTLNQDNSISVSYAETGDATTYGGMLYASDPTSIGFSSYAENYPTYYDEEEGIYHMGLFYHTAEKVLWTANEKMEITWDTADGDVKTAKMPKVQPLSKRKTNTIKGKVSKAQFGKGQKINIKTRRIHAKNLSL